MNNKKIKFEESQYSFYTYIKIPNMHGYDWEKHIKKFINRMKIKNYKYSDEQFGDFRKEPCDISEKYMGAPLYFIKRSK